MAVWARGHSGTTGRFWWHLTDKMRWLDGLEESWRIGKGGIILWFRWRGWVDDNSQKILAIALQQQAAPLAPPKEVNEW